MKHILATDMLEGFEHVSTIANQRGDVNKDLQLISKYTEELGVYSTFRILHRGEFITDTIDLKRAIEVYNDL